ncbi:hypothetical protein MIND_00581100 [Mycena indigotica]|uniref:Uncharacterized protein n=1 Tax=Mycena indigotica TaxID=2126181 RepID=A0A8H6W8V2_9AGAR|nr:uncharacterized protein MIND_00581100 [Mycena indigotica]KAF7303519.1 hypothetical protein MIND_00581100 [Mycena indigotica]
MASGPLSEPLLPQELLNLVLYFAGIPTLKACALAGTQLREPSQRLLFAHFTLAVDIDSKPRLSALLDALAGPPSVARHVRELEFRISRAVILDLVHAPGSESPEFEIGAILELMDGVRTLTLDMASTVPSAMLPVALRDALVMLVCRSNVAKLRLQCVPFADLLFLVSGAKGLRELELSGVLIATDSDTDTTADGNHDPGAGGSQRRAVSFPPMPSLARLSVDNIHGIVLARALVFLADITLRYLHVTFQSGVEARNIQDFLASRQVPAELAHLRLTCTHWQGLLPIYPDISRLSALTTFEADLRLPSQYIITTRADATDYVAWLAHVLQTATGCLQVENILLNVQLQTSHEADLFFVRRLEPLDLLIGRAFPHLRAVVVAFQPTFNAAVNPRRESAVES